MATVINLRKSVETIRLSDDPDAKEYRIVFTDASLRKMGKAFEELKEAIDGYEDDKEKALEAARGFVIATAGQECWDDAVAYVDVNGDGEQACFLQLVPLMLSIGELVMERIGIESAERIRRYTAEAAHGAAFKLV
ncbi:hypothetical protein AAY81_03935 [Denitrobacterium detoxificans]|uniref:Uncharacterized protein n=1 Tax=Denitrobacterium detoxificans TaxID=79604 RepID=A0A172RXR3_9ACTN|nr:hypothetical protein [Denitrobacterium detoxificans]ANE22413.1 hypothetical protein AAY81_03935 [Denitrobacterium detoxificans]SEP00718.1 hypothetical protein SAMN02910314_01895 [Denitrobacterium detoxificans]